MNSLNNILKDDEDFDLDPFHENQNIEPHMTHNKYPNEDKMIV